MMRFRGVDCRAYDAAYRDTRPIEDEHTHVAADAATPRWDGQRLDRPYALSVLAQRRQIAS